MPDKALEGYLTQPQSTPTETQPNNNQQTDTGQSANVEPRAATEQKATLFAPGINLLVSAASPLLSLLSELNSSMTCTDINRLHNFAMAEVQAFDAKAQGYNIHPKTVLAARYMLCTAVDELVLNTEWGGNSNWSRHSLLSLFHNETFGGERFFIITNFVSREPAKNLDLLELIYIILSLNFKGKYYNDSHHNLLVIQNNLFDLITKHRNMTNNQLSNYTRPVTIKQGNLFFEIPLWVIAAVSSVIFLAAVIVNNDKLVKKVTPVYYKLQNIASGRVG
jgi:type VI secretion system protein ImpK